MGRNKQNHNDSSVIINDNEVTDYQVIANKFKEYFSTEAEKLMEKIPHTNQNPLKYLENQPKSSLFLSAASPWEIKKMLNEILSKNSSGWDDIPSVVVKKITRQRTCCNITYIQSVTQYWYLSKSF